MFPLSAPAAACKLVAAYRQDHYLSRYENRFIEITRQTLSGILPQG